MFLINIRLNKCVIKVFLENGGTLTSAPDWWKNQQICDKAVDSYPHAFKFVPDGYLHQKMRDKAVNTHDSRIQKFVPEWYKTQEICDKAVNRSFRKFIYISDQYKTQEMCDRVISEDPFMP